jgi:hypothetical protein
MWLSGCQGNIFEGLYWLSGKVTKLGYTTSLKPFLGPIFTLEDVP